jgi:hypothetical protein
MKMRGAWFWKEFWPTSGKKRALDKKLHALMEEFGDEFITVNNKIRLRD